MQILLLLNYLLFFFLEKDHFLKNQISSELVFHMNQYIARLFL